MDKSADKQPKDEYNVKPKPNIRSWWWGCRTKMEQATFLFGALSGLTVIVVTALSVNGHRYSCLWLSFVGFVLAGLSGTCFLHAHWRAADSVKESKDAAADSLLIPGDGATPDVCAKTRDDLPAFAVGVYLGSVVIWVDKFPYTVLSQRDEPMLIVGRDEAGVWISAKFFDLDGKIVCELVKNRIHLRADRVFRADRTPHRLTVFDDEAKEMLDIDFINPNSIRIVGDFFLREQIRIVITPESFTCGLGEIRNLALYAPNGSGIGIGGPLQNEARLYVTAAAVEDPPKHIRCGIWLHNSGRNPAKLKLTMTTCVHSKAPIDKDAVLRAHNEAGEPGTYDNLPFPGGITAPIMPLIEHTFTAEEMDRLIAGKELLAFCATVRYLGESDKETTITTIWVYDPHTRALNAISTDENTVE